MARGCAQIDSRPDTAKIAQPTASRSITPGYLQLLGYEKRFHTAWVKTGKAHSEHMFSALPSKADIRRTGWDVRSVPILLQKSVEGLREQ
jgi:hypothetical protein